MSNSKMGLLGRNSSGSKGRHVTMIEVGVVRDATRRSKIAFWAVGSVVGLTTGVIASEKSAGGRCDPQAPRWRDTRRHLRAHRADSHYDLSGPGGRQAAPPRLVPREPAGQRGRSTVTDKMDPETRRVVASAGGRARIDALSPEQATVLGRAGAARANAPASLARRIAKAWPALSAEERAEVRAILRTLLR
jgi:hypothetical protein